MIKQFLCILYAAMLVFTSKAQQNSNTTVSRKQRAISQATELYKQNQFDEAVEVFLMAFDYSKTLEASDAQAMYLLGSAIMQSSYDSASLRALPYLKKSLELDSTVSIMAPLSMYMIQRERELYNEAEEWLNYSSSHFTLNDKQTKLIETQRSEIESLKQQLEAGKLLKQQACEAHITLLDTMVNTEADDYFPSLSADESILYFTSVRKGSVGGLQNGVYNEDLWFCEATAEGNWGQAKNMGKPVNTENNNGIAAITGDGQTVICCRCNEESGWGSCDLYQAFLTGDKWSIPQNMGKRINTSDWDAQPSISADGNILVWSSKRTGGLGGQDIWWSKRDSIGHWTEPQNIGSPINTSGEEHSPFITPDGKTLYFSSDNQSPRIGRLDIYKSHLQANNTWSKPENLGYPINSEFDDRHFVLSPSGLRAYFSSNRNGGRGRSDIYEITFPILNQTAYYTFVGKVLDAESKLPLDADIKIEDLDGRKTVGTYRANSSTGKFVVVLVPGRNYSLTVSKKTYLFHSENFNIVNTKQYRKIEKQVLLSKIKTGNKIILNNVFFDSGKSNLRLESNLEIEKLYTILRENPQITVEISGHTDNVGNPTANIKLSTDRAQVIKQALIAKGIDANKLKTNGYGQKKPIASNTSEEGRQQNRRTEFLILAE